MTRKSVLLMMAGMAVVLTGCENSAQTPAATAPPPAPATDMIFADGWTKIDIYANYAHTTIDSGAHFNTDRNRCGYDAYGAMAIATWNAMAKEVNTFMKSSRMSEEKCRDLSDADYRAYKFDGTADLIMADGSKIMLFETRSWSVCSLIVDTDLHQKLLKVINDVVVAADKEDCSHSLWGGVF